MAPRTKTPEPAAAPTGPQIVTARETLTDLLDSLAPANTGLDPLVYEVVVGALDKIESLPALTTLTLGPADETGQIAQLTLVVSHENAFASKITTITANGPMQRVRVHLEGSYATKVMNIDPVSLVELTVDDLTGVFAKLDGVGVIMADDLVASRAQDLSGKTIADMAAVEVRGNRYVRMLFTDGETTLFHHQT